MRKMTTNEIFELLFGEGKLSTTEISLKMNHSTGYLSKYRYRKSVPSTDVMARIMDAVDYDLLIRNRTTGEEILVDPDRHDMTT